jgi:hypothetical protein
LSSAETSATSRTLEPIYKIHGITPKKTTILILQGEGRGKAIPVTGHGGPKRFEMLRLPHFLDNQLTDGGGVVKPYEPSYPHNTP